MKSSVVDAVTLGNIEALEQGIRLVESLTDEQYVHIALPYVTSSIGQHFRHLVDLYFSVLNGIKFGDINYDSRRRGAEIEISRHVAIDEMTVIKSWVESMRSESEGLFVYGETLSVTSEVTLEETNSVSMPSSLIRELAFTSSHAVHHFAIINIIAKMQGVETNNRLGVAPATATFIRDVGNEKISECAQ